MTGSDLRAGLQEVAEGAEGAEKYHASALPQGFSAYGANYWCCDRSAPRQRSGLIESIYEWCLLHELKLHGLTTEHQRVVRITYKGIFRDEPLRFDVLVEGCVLVEAKSVERILPVHKAQLLSYMKLLNVPLGLLINFNVSKLSDGVSRLILPGASS